MNATTGPFERILPPADFSGFSSQALASERPGKDVESLKGEFADVVVTARLGAGRAYKEIVRVAHEERADLIVVGAQGHGRFEHLLSGSNAQQVIRKANCAVLTVRSRPLEDVS